MKGSIGKLTVAGVASAAVMLSACGGSGGNNPGAMGDVNGTGMSAAKVFVRGSITGFGSVIVEGKRFDTSNAMIDIDDLPSATEDALRVGQIVEIRGRRDDNGNFEAERVRYDAEIRGAVEFIDLDNRSLTVAGQQIRIVGGTVFEDGDLSSLAIDDPVEVSGEITGEGVLIASYVERESQARAEAEVTGRLAALDTAQRRFRVQNLAIDYNTAMVEPEGIDLAEGQLVEVEGTLAGGVLTASRVEVEDAPGRDDDDDGLDDGTEAEIDGAVVDLDVRAGTFLVRGITVRFDASTDFKEGTAQDLANGVLVEVEGLIAGDGAIDADEIDFEEERNANPGAERIELEGDVQSVDAEAGTLQVLGTTVQTNERTRFEDDRDEVREFGLDDLRRGDAVEIAAVRSEGAIVAIRIEREERDDDDGDDGEDDRDLEGKLESKDDNTRELVIAGVRVDASNAAFEDEDESVTAETFFSRVAVGDFLEAEGRFDDNLQRFVATKVEREREEDDDRDEGDDESGDGESDDDSDDSDGRGEDNDDDSEARS